MFNPKLWFRIVVLKYVTKYVDAHEIQQEMNLKFNIDIKVQPFPIVSKLQSPKKHNKNIYTPWKGKRYIHKKLLLIQYNQNIIVYQNSFK